VGITSNLQGKRADLLIADDVESLKNSQTAVMRAQLLNITRDFSSICSDGRIIYLGTPQSIESIYNTLPGLGLHGAYLAGPRPERGADSSTTAAALAPSIARKAKAHPELMTGYGMDGKQGAATDTFLTDEILLKKEMAQGQAFFQLQHMLLTALTDALRFPLKTENLIAMRLDGVNLPLKVVRSMAETSHEAMVCGRAHSSLLHGPERQRGDQHSPRPRHVRGPCGRRFQRRRDGIRDPRPPQLQRVPTGRWWHSRRPRPDKLQALATKAVQWRPTVIKIEKNMGFGLFREVLQPIIKAAFDKAGLPMPAIEDDLVVGQKEQRIIGTIEPVLGRGSLIINEDILLARVRKRLTLRREGTHHVLVPVPASHADTGQELAKAR
jgi:hypothetical protein